MPLSSNFNKPNASLIDRITNIGKRINQLIIGDSVDDLISAENSIKRLNHYVNFNDTAKLSDLLKKIAGDYKYDKNDTQSLYEKFINKNSLTAQGIEGDRLNRYKEYDSIETKIPYLSRALTVLTQNIMTPEDYTGKSLIPKLKSKNIISDIDVTSDIEEILENYEINNYMRSIIYTVLKYGDYFVELVPTVKILRQYKLVESPSYEIPNQHVLKEFVLKYQIGDKHSKITFNLIESANNSKSVKPENDIENLNYSRIDKPEDSKMDQSKKNAIKNDVFLNFISPINVVRLGDKFCFGYLVFPDASNISGRISDIKSSENRIQTIIGTNSSNIQNTVNGLLDAIKSKMKITKNAFSKLDETEKDLYSLIAKLLITTPNKESIDIRFVDPDNMVHFNFDRTHNPPYGTSILYGTEFLSRILIAIEGSIMIQRITRAVEKRIVKVEQGISRDAQSVVAEAQQQMVRRKFNIDNVGSIDSVASQLATFEDIYSPMKNGRSYMEIESIPQGEISSRVDDLKTIRDQLIAGIPIPPAYIGVEENIESKSTLSQQNIVFATSIINYQKELSRKFTELVHKIILFTKGNQTILNYDLTFPTPLSLISEQQANYYDSVSKLIESAKSLGISTDFLLNKFLANISKAEQETTEINNTFDNILNPKKGKSDNNANY